MEISPEMVRDAIANIIRNELNPYLEVQVGNGMGCNRAVQRAATILTRHCYSFAELPEPKLEEIS